MRIPILGITIDERFLAHRRRSTSIGSVAGGLVAIGLFAYRYFVTSAENRVGFPGAWSRVAKTSAGDGQSRHRCDRWNQRAAYGSGDRSDPLVGATD
jgi:hypothetical protein